MISWKDGYLTGIEMIDKQHKELFSLANELCRSLLNNTELDRSFIITRLEMYSMFHFTTEEQLMVKCGYEELEKHKKEHELFRRTILSMKERFLENESMDVAEEIHKFIEEWLLSHTTEIDQQFVPCLQKYEKEFLRD